MTRYCLILALLFLPAPSFAQDQIDVTRTRMWNSPGDMMSWPVTTKITSVYFNDIGFPVDFDKRDGPNRWTDQITPGWDGPLEYSLGICLAAPGHAWDCSAVVQFWNGRQQQYPDATACPYCIAKEWFFDTRWGPLAYRNPRPNELVGLFVCRGDCRGNTPLIHERSNVALVTWGQTYLGSSAPAPEPTPSPVPAPQPSPAPTPSPQPPPPSFVLTPEMVRRIVNEEVDRVYAQNERIFDDETKRLEALAAQLKKHDEDPTVVRKFLSSRYAQMAITAVTTLLTARQVMK